MKLSKFVGRNERPSDKSAFDLITRAFANYITDKVAIFRRIRKSAETKV